MYSFRADADADLVSTEALMDEVRAQVRDDLHARLTALASDTELADRAVFDDVVALFRRGLASEQAALLLPSLMPDEWRPRLALDLKSHRAPLAARPILFVKRRILAPAMRWLFEYSQDNFKRQDQLNRALLACLQALAADHARVKARLAALEAARDRGRFGEPR